MKNNDIIRNAMKAAGITETVHTYTQWKAAGYQVRKGEKAALKAAIWYRYGKKWFQKETPFFTENQVKRFGTVDNPEDNVTESPEVNVIEPVNVPETEPVTLEENERFRIIPATETDPEKFFFTFENGKGNATFVTSAIIGLNKADFTRFVKNYVHKADETKMVTDYLDSKNLNREYWDIMMGKKSKQSEVTKILNSFKKSERLYTFQLNEKAYITDSYSIIECDEREAIYFIENNQAVKNVVKDYQGDERCKNLPELLNKFFNQTVKTSVDFSKILLTKEKYGKKTLKYYMFDKRFAGNAKYIDSFKNKTFNVTENNVLIQEGNGYRFALLPIRRS